MSLLVVLLVGLAGCQAGDDDDSIFVGDDDDATWEDPGGDDDAFGDDDAPGDDDTEQDDDDVTADGPVATLQGVVTRSAPMTLDGVGDLYISAFASDPSAGGSDEPAAFLFLGKSDLSTTASSVAYSLQVPVSAQPWYVLAIFDDDKSGLNPEPGPGDLMSLGDDGAPSVVADTEGETVPLDLVLTVAL